MIRLIPVSLVAAALVIWHPSFVFSVTVISSGIDTTLAEDGLDGPDLSHNVHPENDNTLWEFDGEDGTNFDTGEPGQNHGMLWLDIPQQSLSAFREGDIAILQLHIFEGGDQSDVYRVTTDWLSGPQGGNEATWNDVPGGPGIVPGQNAEATSSFTFPRTTGSRPMVFQTDVSDDLLAWARGAPNFGWAFVPPTSSTIATKVTSFEDIDDPVPALLLASRLATPIQRTTANNTNLGHLWKYWDVLGEGDNPYPMDAQGDLWNEPGFDDSRWPSGPAIFGHGNLRGSDDTEGMAIDETPEANELPFGTVINSSAPDANPRIRRETDLFRSTFNVSNLDNVTGIGFEVLAEDGAVIYINGVEVARANVTDDPVTTGSRPRARSGADESTYVDVVSVIGPQGIRRNPLVVGENTIAVELHQNRAITDDRGFDLAISLLGPPGTAPSGPELKAGDADQDLDFDQLDLVQVQIASKYLTGQAATWGEGDWTGAPGGNPGNPPAGDGLFNQLDIIAASLANTYLTGPYAAIARDGIAGDGQTSVLYNAVTGEVAVDAPAGMELTSINIDSAAGIFTGEAAQNLGASFDNDADGNIFKATFGGSFGSVSFGNVAQTGLSKEFLLNDLGVVGSLAGGGDLGAVELIYVPEPSTIGLFVIALIMGLGSCKRMD